MEFVEDVRFDHLGVFTYSDAEDLPSHRLPGQLSKKVAQFRYDTLMKRQMAISENNLTSMIGKTLPVLVEASSEPRLFEGRTILQAPEVDGITFVKTHPGGPTATIGEIASVTITDTLAYDLIGRAL
jgi:ribosomal protein S12 methylthiotransferase